MDHESSWMRCLDNCTGFDEITTGLDSAAAYDVITLIQAAVRAFRHTCIISLLQPPPEVFALFDEVSHHRCPVYLFVSS